MLEVALEKRLLFDKGAEEREQEEHRLQLQQERMVRGGFVVIYFGGWSFLILFHLNILFSIICSFIQYPF